MHMAPLHLLPQEGLAGAALTILVGILVFRFFKDLLVSPSNSTFRIPEKGDPSSAIVLVDFSKIPGVASSCSPFVSKVETWLRFHNFEFTKKFGDLNEAPLKKFPYIEHDGKKIPESGFIIRYLTNTYPDKVPKLKPEQEALSRAVCALLETNFGLGMGQHRWLDKEGLKATSRVIFADLPPVVKSIVPLLVRSKMYKVCKALGMNSLSENDKHVLLAADSAALSALLGDKLYLTGDQPAPADASLFGFLDNALNDGITPVMSGFIRKHGNLVAFVERIRKTFYPELRED